MFINTGKPHTVQILVKLPNQTSEINTLIMENETNNIKGIFA